MGKNKYIETPEKLMDIFKEYAKHTKSNPITKHVFVGRDGDSRYEERERPLTLDGFYNYCYINHSDVHHYFENTDKRYEDYRGICTRIKQLIRQDQIEGGMANIYNPSITQRLNNLVDRSDITSKDKKINLPPFMVDDESES